MSQSINSDNDSKAPEDRDRLRELGMQCVSPGFGKMDDRMLSTIRLSRDIAKEQKEAIQKLGSGSTTTPPLEVKIQTGGDDENLESAGPDSGLSSAGNVEENAGRTSSKSLKRARIPPPLNIRAGGSGTAPHSAVGAGGRFTGAKSAPAHITRYPRGKSRVQYLGRLSEHEYAARKQLRSIPNWQPMVNVPFTPYPYYPHPASAMPYQAGWQQGAFHPFQGPFMASNIPPQPAHPMFQPQYQQDVPESSVKCPTSSLQRDFEAYRNKNPGVGTRDLFYNNKSRWAPIQAQPQSARDEFFGTRAKVPERSTSASGPVSSQHANTPSTSADNVNADGEGEEKDNEEVDLAIEEGAQPSQAIRHETAIGSNDSHKTPATSRIPAVMQGEIRLNLDSFAFSFSMLEHATDKKMFMSICDKVWDEAQEIAKQIGEA